jgi:hypothetical protein
MSLLARLERFGKLAENAVLVVLLGSLVLLAAGHGRLDRRHPG